MFNAYKAQYFILTAVVMAAVMFSVVLIASIYSSHRQSITLEYKSTDVIAVNVKRELKGLSETLLVNATRAFFNGTLDIAGLRRDVGNKLKAFTKLVQEAYLPMNTNLNIIVREPIRIKGVTLENGTLDDIIEGRSRSLIKIIGYSEKGIAIIALNYDLEYEEPYTKVYNGYIETYFYAEIQEYDMLDVDTRYVIVYTEWEKNEAITEIQDVNMWIYVVNNETGEMKWLNIIPQVEYLGDNKFRITYNTTYIIDDQTYILASGFEDQFTISLSDPRGVTLELSTIKWISVKVQSKAYEAWLYDGGGGETLTNETYVFELLPNGTLYCNFKKIGVLQVDGNNIILPPVPVEYIRINYSDPDTGLEPTVALMQVENWKDFYTPCDNPQDFIVSRGRLKENYKIVFLVPFDSDRENVNRTITIWWITDPDLYVTPTLISVVEAWGGMKFITNIIDPNTSVKTNIYNVTFLIDREIVASHTFDYNLIIEYGDYHVEVGTFAYDLTPIYELTIPEDETISITFPNGTTIIYLNTDSNIYTIETLNESWEALLPGGTEVWEREFYENYSIISTEENEIAIARIVAYNSITLVKGDEERILVGNETYPVQIIPPSNQIVKISGVQLDSYWLPRMLLSGEVSNNFGWKIYQGKIRALMYRSSDKVYNYPANFELEGHVNHTELVILPVTNYFYYIIDVKVINDTYTHPLVYMSWMVSGNRFDEGDDIRLNHWACYSNGIQKGIYPRYWNQTRTVYHQYDMEDVKYFISQYRSGIVNYPNIAYGIIFNSTELNNAADNILIDDSVGYEKVIRFWVSLDYSRRVSDISRLYPTQDSTLKWVTLRSGSNASYTMVFFSTHSDYTLIWGHSYMFNTLLEVLEVELTG